MKTVEVKTFEFEELSPEAQEKAIEWYRESQRYDTSIWFENMVKDAKETADFKITELDDNPVSGSGSFISSARETAEAILANHGGTCETYQVAETFRDAHVRLCDELKELEDDLGEALDTDGVLSRIDTLEAELEELEQEFERDIAREYGKLWSREIKYQTSDDAIKENIEANGYEFLEDGTRFVVQSSYAVK